MLQPHPITSFTIWACVDAYQVLWLIYIATATCRRIRDSNSFIYCIEGVIPVPSLLFFTAGMVARSMAVLASYRLHYLTALSASGLTPVVFWVSVKYALCCFKKSENSQDIHTLTDNVLVPVLIHNGLCCLATWSTLTFDVQVCSALTSLLAWKESSAEITALLIISVEVVAWCIIDWITFRHHLTFVVTPYVILIATLVAIADFKPKDLMSCIPSILLGLVIVVTMVRIMRTIWETGHLRQRYYKASHHELAETGPLPDLIPLNPLPAIVTDT